jgi:hypothetical protein
MSDRKSCPEGTGMTPYVLDSLKISPSKGKSSENNSKIIEFFTLQILISLIIESIEYIYYILLLRRPWGPSIRI